MGGRVSAGWQFVVAAGYATAYRPVSRKPTFSGPPSITPPAPASAACSQVAWLDLPMRQTGLTHLVGSTPEMRCWSQGDGNSEEEKTDGIQSGTGPDRILAGRPLARCDDCGARAGDRGRGLGWPDVYGFAVIER